MEGIYGTIMTEKVKEWVSEANLTIAILTVQFERHSRNERQRELVKIIKAKLAANKCQTAADYSQLAELVNLSELDEFNLMFATIEQDKWTEHLCGDFFILRRYAHGFIPIVKDPSRKQLLNSKYWTENMDIFPYDRE